MKFVALVSGGKDSCYNILHCLKQGHELVALANLYPIDSSKQELDSFMFQTVGHDIVAYYGRCTGLPLFRRPIKADSSKNVELNYTPTMDDEIEDLYDLLSEIKAALPDVKAVSVGAILSSYQRTRVEDVCGRLDLVVLSYLWQRDQLELMNEICSMSKQRSDKDNGSCKMDARIIKVAAVGLDKTSLNKSLPEIFPMLKKLNQLYDVHICGEGGEFETMVLDAPFFTEGKLNVVSQSQESLDANCGVYNTNLKVEFEERKTKSELQSHLQKLPVPPLLDAKWQALLEKLEHTKDSTFDIIANPSGTTKLKKNVGVTPSPSVNQLKNLLYISNLRSKACSLSVEQQTQDVFDQLNSILMERNLSPCQVLRCSLILSDMSLFAGVNKVYNKNFSVSKYGPLPPARACVESKLLNDQCILQLSVIVDLSNQVTKLEGRVPSYKNKNGLHVQGRSYWAPCNIGPYSQAIWLQNDGNKVSYLSGQIPLDPSSMEMISTNARLQSVVSLRHFDTLKTTLDLKRQLFMTCFTVKSEMISVISDTWHLYCSKMANESDLWMDKSDDPREFLIIVKISRLPRQALCEWGGIACNDLDIEAEEENENKNVLDPVKVTSQDVFPKEFLHDIAVTDGQNRRHFMTGFMDNDYKLLDLFQSIVQSCNVTLYYNPSDIGPIQDELSQFTNIEYYPVEQVYDYKGAVHLFGFHISA